MRGNRQGPALPGTALDPDTRSLARNAAAPSPKGVNKQVQGLTAFIRPSSSTEQFKANHAKQWMQINTRLPQDHHRCRNLPQHFRSKLRGFACSYLMGE